MTQAPNTGKKIQNYVFNYSDFLGKGNFSKCYKATHIKTQQVVAIKIVELNSLKSKKLQQLLFQQIAILKELNHPNVLRCFEVFTSNRNCYIITEHCNQGDLETKIKKRGALDAKEVPKILADVYNGLTYLTSKGIIHRDLKIANVFLHDGKAKIADFGFAMHCSGNFQDLNIGSPLYMSPEGFLKNTYGLKTDVWSFGVMVYELYHNRTPFCGCRTEKELKTAIMTPLSYNNLKASVPEEAKELILACLQISEDKRPLMSDLKRYAYIQQIMKVNNFGSQSTQLKSSPQKYHQLLNTIQVEPAKNAQPVLRNQQRSRTMDRFNSPTKVLFNGPAYLTNSKDVRTPQQGLHQNNYNSTEFKFQSPQVKRSNGYLHQSQNNVNGSLNFTPASERQRYPSEQRSKTKLITVVVPQSKRNTSLIDCQLNFKESVSIIHYCRLIFKYLNLYKESTHLRQPFHKKHYAILGHFLLMMLDEIHREIVSKRIRYQGNNPQMRERKLNEVNQEYRRKYAQQLDQSVLKLCLTEEQRNHMTIPTVRQFIQAAIINSFMPEDCTNREAIIGQLLLTIYSSTILVEQSSNNRNYQTFQKNKDIEEILNRNTNLFNYTSYTRHRNQLLNVDHMIAI